MDYTHANVRLGDMDNDSDLDIVIGNHSEQNVVYINQGNGVFSSVLFGPSNDTTEDLDIGDFNNDGFLDIIVGNGSGFPNVLYLNNGNNVYNSFCSFSSRTNSISAGDVNGDGYIDVLITKYRSQGMPLRYLVWAEGKTSGK